MNHRINLSAVILLAGLQASAIEVREIASKTLASTVFIQMEDVKADRAGVGSGFFVAPGVIATNFHVINGFEQGKARVVGHNTYLEIRGFIAVAPEHDLALVIVEDQSVPVLPLSGNIDLGIGDTVYAAGNPNAIEGTFSDGIVSAVRQIGSDTFIQITAPISPGSSGGPVTNRDGEVIGIASGTYTGGQNLNFAVPVAYLQALILRKHPVRPLSTLPKDLPQPTFLTGTLGELSLESLKYADGRFIDNRNGTITDTKTGRIWQKQDSATAIPLLRTNPYQLAGFQWPYVDMVNAQISAGHSNWRMPTKEDFESLNLEEYRDEDLPFVVTGDGLYWYSKTSVGAFRWKQRKFSSGATVNFNKPKLIRLVADP